MVITEYKGETMNQQEVDKMLAKFGYRRLTGTVNKSKWLVKHQLPNKGFGMRMAFGPDDKQAQTPSAYRTLYSGCLLYTSPSPRDRTRSRMPSSA